MEFSVPKISQFQGTFKKQKFPMSTSKFRGASYGQITEATVVNGEMALFEDKLDLGFVWHIVRKVPLEVPIFILL
jgi:hypothetical protein